MPELCNLEFTTSLTNYYSLKDVKDTFFYRKKTSSSGGKLIYFKQPAIMGIVNCTPDSFYDGGKNYTVDSAIKGIEEMIAAGVDLVDIGGYSSRPQAIDIDVQEEIDRVIPVIQEARKCYPNLVISIDTFRAEVAQAALEQGASMVNDISGGTLDSDMFAVVAKANVPYIMMHMRGTPQTMNKKTTYTDLIDEVIHFFIQQTEKAKAAGVRDIILDPGFGFAKNTEQNFELIKQLEVFKIFELPILVGISRKSMIYKTLDIHATEALNGTTVLNTLAIEKGVDILRVHDVKEAKEAVTLTQMMR